MDMLVPEQPPTYVIAGKQDILVNSHFVNEGTSPSYVGTCLCSQDLHQCACSDIQAYTPDIK